MVYDLSWIKIGNKPYPIYSTVKYTDDELNAKFMERQFVSALKAFEESDFEVGGFMLFKNEVIAFPAVSYE